MEHRCHICKSKNTNEIAYKGFNFFLCEACENMFLEGERSKYFERCMKSWRENE